MVATITIPIGTIGNNTGTGSDGVFGASIAATALSKFYRNSAYIPSTTYCITDDGGAYVNDSTDFSDAGDDDVSPFPAAPAVDDAFYVGSGSDKFGRVDFDITTADTDLVATFEWQYWTGTAWAALAGVSDGTVGWTAAVGIRSLTFTVPTDWAQNTVDSVLAYWVRCVCTAFTSVTAVPLVGTGFVVTNRLAFEEDTTDINDADASDVAIFSDYPVVGDQAWFGYTTKFCKVKVTLGTARAGTATVTLKYWNGSALVALAVSRDDSTGFSAGTSTYLLHFIPPTDWVANTTSNGPSAHFYIVAEVTAFTSQTANALATQAWVLPIAGAPLVGMKMPASMASTTFTRVNFNAVTASATNDDSVFLLINKTAGTQTNVTWTKAVKARAADITFVAAGDDEIAVIQITEDGTTEFATGFLQLMAA